MLFLASLVAVVGIPVRFTLPHAPTSPTPERGEMSPTTVARTPGERLAANMLGAGFALQSLASTGTTVCLVWHLVRKVIRYEQRPSSLVRGAAQVPGRWLLAPLQRAVRSELRLPLLFVLQAGALIGIAVGSRPLLGPAVFVFGAVGGTMTLERASVVLEWFGRESFGTRSGHIASIAFLARAASPYTVEVLHGTTGYAGVLGVLALGLAGGSVVMSFASRVCRPAIS